MSNKYLPRANPRLYEINTAAWLFELSRKAGKPVLLGDVPSSEWDRLKALGMDYVWLMGVWQRSEEGRKVSLNGSEFQTLFQTVLPGCTEEDIIGSCYSISSGEPDPLVGTWADLDYTRNELHKRNMGLILDFIPNHRGIGHHWLSEHPEYFIQGREEDYRRYSDAFFPVDYQGKTLYIAHGRDPNFGPWTDTSQLNYFNPDTRRAMIDRLKQIALHCDGVRCDMAMLVLNDVFQKTWGWANRDPYYPPPSEEFWAEAVRQVPDLIYIAEAYWDTEWTLQQLGFDYAYDKRLYDRLRNSSPHEIYLHLTAGLDFQSKLVRFIENHDEQRSLEAFGPEKVKPAAVLFSGLPGMKLYFHGQLEGRRIHMPLQIRQTRPEAEDPDITAFYRNLLSIVNSDIFHSGAWRLKEAFIDSDKTAENLLAYLWKLADRLALVIVNLTPEPSLARICFADDVDESLNYSLTDRFSDESFIRHGKLMAHPGLRFKLAGYQSQVFDIVPAGEA